MTQARWQTVKSLFFEAIALNESEREAFLRDMANADEEVSEQLRALLAADPVDSVPDLRQPCWAAAATEVSKHAPALSPALEPGRRLAGRFEIAGFLGAGGLGEVYRAFDHERNRFVAIKTLRPALTEDPAALNLLRRELNTAQAVTHPNVCRVFDIHFDGATFFTMELLEGETLASRLEAGGAFDNAAAQELVEQILDGLEAIHKRGIVHRDLKSTNIMLTDGGSRVVLLDFGLAREVKHAGDLASTLAASEFAGTPAYMAPEQLRGQPATGCSDIYSLGVVLFEMFTGRRPFEGATPVEAAAKRLNEAAPSPRKYRPGISRRWEYVILECLRAEPSRRLQTVGAVRAALSHQPALWHMRPTRRQVLFGGTAAGTAAGALFFRSRFRSAQVDTGATHSSTSGGSPGKGLALDYYLRGRTLLENPSPSGTRSALQYFRQAVEADPAFALGWSGLADANMLMMNYVTGSTEPLLADAKISASRAIALDPGLAEAHTALAAVYQSELDWERADRSFKEALRLKPVFPRLHRWYAGFVLQFGRFAEVDEHARLALSQDPHDPMGPLSVGFFYLFADRSKEAIALMEPAVEGRYVDGIRNNLGQAYARMAQKTSGEERREWIRKSLDQVERLQAIEARQKPDRPYLSDRVGALTHTIAGNHAEAAAMITRLREDVEKHRMTPADLSWTYAVERDYGTAISLLERARADSPYGLIYIKVNPFLENLRGQPRFERLVQDLRL